MFKQVLQLIELKEHLNLEGLIKIVAIKTTINCGLCLELKLAFPDVVPVVRPLVKIKKIKYPNWLAGFTSGEGCFLIGIQARNSSSLGYQVYLEFKL